MNKYQKRINKEFPNLKFSEIKECSNGVDHKVFFLDKKYIFRFPKRKYYKDFLFIEINFLNKINSKFTPKYKWIASDFAGYIAIQGKPLTKYSYSNIEDKNKLHKDIASFLTKLHLIKEPKGIPKRENKKLAKELKQRFPTFKKLLTKEERSIVEKYLKTLEELKCPKTGLIHGDLHNDHVIVDKKLKGFIDFSDAEIGDPAKDFHFLWNISQKSLKEVYSYYKGPKDSEFLCRSFIYHLADFLSALYHSEKSNKPEWREPALRVVKKSLKRFNSLGLETN